MKLYNTMTKKKEEFVPLEEGKVGMYVCGPTVYDYIHVGNARPIIVFDVLRRYLEHLGYKVTFVQNITDVDDKLINRAKREDMSVPALAEKFTAEYIADLKALGSKPATYSPKATEHIAEIIALIRTLEGKGLAYATENGDVYFDTQVFPLYGKLSGQDMDELEAGARVEVGEIKRHPMDFALWKAMKPGELAWDSPWGKGRPGWHIECSAMSMKYLGATLDIHAGGQDLIFPHHENEIAQSEGATGKPFVRYWLHNGHLNIDNQKMSKSLGNFLTVKDILAQFEPEVLRFFMLSAHYRSPLNFSFDLMRQAETALQRIYTAKENLLHLLGEEAEGPIADADEMEKQYILEFKQAMDDDLNTADAIGSLFSLVKYYNTRYIQSDIAAIKPEIRGAVKILQDLSEVLGLLGKRTDDIPEEILVMAEQRKQARERRDWALSDQLRDQIKAKGYLVEDTKEGQKVKAQ
jgi:cysteinyl-tRNA synthetase